MPFSDTIGPKTNNLNLAGDGSGFLSSANVPADSIMSDIPAFNPPPDKTADGLAWAAHMTEIHRIAEKMMLEEIASLKIH